MSFRSISLTDKNYNEQQKETINSYMRAQTNRMNDKTVVLKRLLPNIDTGILYQGARVSNLVSYRWDNYYCISFVLNLVGVDANTTVELIRLNKENTGDPYYIPFVGIDGASPIPGLANEFMQISFGGEYTKDILYGIIGNISAAQKTTYGITCYFKL